MTESQEKWSVELFDSKVHNRKNFTCGAQVMDDYFKKYSSQDQKRNLSRVYVAVDQSSGTVAGYYTLCATTFVKELLPVGSVKNLPNRDLPAVLLGRLAVHSNYQGRGLGEYLVIDAFNNILKANEILGLTVLLVDVLNEKALSFYLNFEFIHSVGENMRMFLPISEIQNKFIASQP